MCPSWKGHEVLLLSLSLGNPSETEAWFVLEEGWKKLPNFSAAQRSPFVPKRWAGRRPSLVYLPVHIFYRVVSGLSRWAGMQNHVGLNSIQHLLPYSHRKIPGPVSQVYSSISSKHYQPYDCCNNSFVAETSIVNIKHMG